MFGHLYLLSQQSHKSAPTMWPEYFVNVHHCAHRQCSGLGCGRNSLRPYTILSRFTRKDAEPVNSYLMTCPHILSV
jgi:hypothetical protein